MNGEDFTVRTTFAEIDRRALCIFVQKMADGSNRAFGSGCFFIRRDIILTAKHVVQDCGHEQSPICVVCGSEEGRLKGARPIEYWSHAEIDIGLVRVEANDDLPTQPLFPAHLDQNRHAGAISLGLKISKSSNLDNSWVAEANHVKLFTVEKRERTGSIEVVMEYEAPFIERGNSGGPLLAMGGGVIAVTTQLFTNVESSDGVKRERMGRATSVYPAVAAFKSPFEYGT